MFNAVVGGGDITRNRSCAKNPARKKKEKKKERKFP